MQSVMMRITNSICQEQKCTIRSTKHPKECPKAVCSPLCHEQDCVAQPCTNKGKRLPNVFGMSGWGFGKVPRIVCFLPQHKTQLGCGSSPSGFSSILLHNIFKNCTSGVSKWLTIDVIVEFFTVETGWRISNH